MGYEVGERDDENQAASQLLLWIRLFDRPVQ